MVAGFREVLESERLRHHCVAPVARIEQGASLREAIGIMRNNRLGCVLVCDSERLVGILTERDLVMKVFGQNIDLNRQVEEFMTASPKTLELDASVAEAMRLMDSGGFRTVPLIDERNRLAGVFVVRHLIDYLAESFPAHVLNLPPRLHQKMEAPDGA